MYCVYRSHNWRLESASNPRHCRYSSQSPVTNHLGVSSRLAAAHQLTLHIPRHGIHPNTINVSPQSGQSAGIPTLQQHLQKYLEMKIKILYKKQDYQQTIEYLLCTQYTMEELEDQSSGLLLHDTCTYMFKRRHC